MIEIGSRGQERQNRILVLLQGQRDAHITSDLLEKEGLTVDVCSDVESLCSRMREGAAAALVAEEALNASAVAQLTDVFDTQPPWSDFPLIVFGSGGDRYEGSARERASTLGNVTFLDRPVRVKTMLAAVRAALRARRRQYSARAEIESRDSFLAMLGHELRNPLGAIQLALSLIQAKDPAAAETKSHKILDRQTRHLSRLVDDLLDVARITHGKVVLKRERLNLAEVLRNAFETTEARAREQRLTYELTVPKEPVFVEGDRQRLDQVFSNLLTNAFKYTPRAGSVSVVLTGTPTSSRVTISDSGVGLEKDQLERIFDVFAQVDSSADRAGGGIGLGLALVRSIVALHGGSVHAESQGRDLGSSFVVELPRVAEVQGQATESWRATPVARKRIVVIEDSPDIRGLMVALLEHQGHDVDSAADGHAGLELLRREPPPEIAFVDIGLPGMDGYAVATAAIESGFRGALVAVSGYGQADDKKRAEHAGFFEHLTKPVRSIDLERTIARISAVTATSA